MYKALNGLSIALFFLVTLTACGNKLAPQQQAALFCQTLETVNRGGVDVSGLAELQGHAKVLNTLLAVAPDDIAEDMEQFHSAFESWASAVDGKKGMIETFKELSEPSLAGAEGRVGDYIAAQCELRLGDGYYKEAPRAAAQDVCPAWPRFVSPLNSNNFPNLPDISGANYFAQDFFMSDLGISINNAFAVEYGGWVELRGQYSQARYFAYHPNDMDLNNLDTLQDRELNPDPGSVNPLRNVPTEGSKNYYTAKLMFTAPPENPEPNTTYVGVKKDGKTPNRYLLNMLRLYGSDIGDGANSGGVPLPAMTIYNSDGEVTEHFAECDLYAKDRVPMSSDLTFPVLPIADHRAKEKATWGTSSNFEAPSDTMANADAQYVHTYYSRRFGDLMVVRGKYVTAPDTRSGVPISSPGYDTQLYTMCTYNIWAGSAIDCMLDTEMTVDDDGYYTLVISDEGNKPTTLEQEQATWIDMGDYLDGQLTYRYVYRDNPFSMAIADGVMGKPVSADMQPYVPIATHCEKSVFESGGWKACFAKSNIDSRAYLLSAAE